MAGIVRAATRVHQEHEQGAHLISRRGLPRPPEREGVAENLAVWASWLSEPLCYVHLNVRRLSLPRSAGASLVEELARRCQLVAACVLWFVLIPIVIIPAVGLRYLGLERCQSRPFLYSSGEARDIYPTSATISVLFWNVCCVFGGYAISDGGVAPWRERIDQLAQRIKDVDRDVVCLQEVFDVYAAKRLIRRLKSQYQHFYWNIGAQAMGVSSGFFVASKSPIKNPQFLRFNIVTGRASWAAKGVFRFGYGDTDIILTHPVHSEEPEFPTENERHARARQLQVVATVVQESEAETVLVGGDFNAHDSELEGTYFRTACTEGVRDRSKETWGGDGFCASLTTGKRASGPLNLDHAFVRNGSHRSLRTYLLDARFRGDEWDPASLSDHHGLVCELRPGA